MIKNNVIIAKQHGRNDVECFFSLSHLHPTFLFFPFPPLVKLQRQCFRYFFLFAEFEKEKEISNTTFAALIADDEFEFGFQIPFFLKRTRHPMFKKTKSRSKAFGTAFEKRYGNSNGLKKKGFRKSIQRWTEKYEMKNLRGWQRNTVQYKKYSRKQFGCLLQISSKPPDRKTFSVIFCG